MAISPMFSKKAIRGAEDLVNKHVSRLAEIFSRKVGTDETLELSTTFLAYTTDLLYEYMFDMDMSYQRNPAATEARKRSMEAVAHATPFLKQFPWLCVLLMELPPSALSWVASRVRSDIGELLKTRIVRWTSQTSAQL